VKNLSLNAVAVASKRESLQAPHHFTSLATRSSLMWLSIIISLQGDMIWLSGESGGLKESDESAAMSALSERERERASCGVQVFSFGLGRL